MVDGVPAYGHASIGDSGVRIMDVWVDNVTMDGAVERIEKLMIERAFSYTVTPNVDHLMKLKHDEWFRIAYEEADLTVPDGVPLIWASRLLGASLPERVNGTDLMWRLTEMAADRDYSVYLLGGSQDTAAAAADTLRGRFDGLRVAGHSSPPIDLEKALDTNKAVIEDVAASGAEILFVGLGAPKQEKWIHAHGRYTGARHAVGIGGSFALISGRIRRAPPWAQRSGLEWAWRLGHEPKRLWRRYLVDDLPFLWYMGRLLARSWLRS